MRDAIISTVRHQASEAVRLRLEQHLAECASCRAEKSHWLLMEHLQEQDPQHLSPEARARILGHLTHLPEPEVVEIGPARRPWPFLWGAGAAAAIIVALLVALPNRHDSILGRTAEVDRPKQTSVDKEHAVTIRAKAAGVLDSGGAHIAYGALAAFRVQPGGRQVELFAGEIDIEVAPGGPGRFRVLAPRFTVEVLGTHFVVALDRVQTLHGLVRVAEPDAAGGRQLALVHAGQTWRLHDVLESAALEPSEPNLFPSDTALVDQRSLDVPSTGGTATAQSDHLAGWESAAQPSAGARLPFVGTRGSASRHVPELAEARVGRGDEIAVGTGVGTGIGTSDSANPSAEQLLADARAALARGNTRRARECVADAVKARPKARQRAIAELLSADTLLVESRYAAALAAYRHTMDVFAKYPEGETAAFALAQLLSERGPQEQAQEALEGYLARYPKGRFVEEVEKKLANTPGP
jgi:ferric-dicitrate binding protein FerR (iron transport regulator)